MEMLMAFEDPQTALVYGRQLPHIGASPLAAQARMFNYPEYSLVKRYEDRATMGIKSAFCSNSFAMYRIHALQAVGGFPLKTILGEDMLVAAKLLKSGYAVRYEAKAQVFHSHNYSCIQEFKRYFDTGVFHFESRMILDEFGGIGSEGMKHFRAQLDLLDGIHGLRKVIFLIDVVFRNTLKYVGYQLGRHHNRLPIELKKSFSMFKGYWNH
jgi:rhamnosyltransferase